MPMAEGDTKVEPIRDIRYVALPQGWLRGLFFIIGQPEVLIC